MIRRLHTETVRDAHGYTRADVPWRLDVADGTCGRLIRYISGGGMRTFGRSVAQEQVRTRRRRFLCGVAACAVLWLLFYIF